MAVAGSSSAPNGGGELTRSTTASEHGSGWGIAFVQSAIVLVLAVVGFGVIPDRLLSWLSLHMSPRGRDLLVSLWVLAFFVFLCLVYVRLQRPRALR